MPTGYTATLMEKGQTFEEFVMTCARAFGALIDLREEPLNAPIPEEFKPSKYYAEALEKAKQNRDSLAAMSSKEKEYYGEKEKKRLIKASEEYAKKEKLENDRLEVMVAKVSVWEPPSKDHRELKDFMLDQLRISKGSDYYTSETKRLNSMEPLEFYSSDLRVATQNVLYYEEQMLKEQGRCTDRTDWVKTLRASLRSK